MIVTSLDLHEKYKNYSDKRGKIARDIKKGLLFPLVKGIYETDPNVDPSLLAQYIYNPSYLSFDYVLSLEGLIPEGVYTYTNATCGRGKRKIYTNHFGTYIYWDIPIAAFNKGVRTEIIDGYQIMLATPEKALCDKLYILPPVLSMKNLKVLMFYELRIDEEEFDKLNKDDLLILAPLYKSTNLNLLAKLIKGEKSNGWNIK